MTDMFEQIYDALNVQVVTLIEQSKSINAQNEALRDALAEKTRQCLRKDDRIAELERQLSEMEESKAVPVPCSERMPGDNIDVLVYVNGHAEPFVGYRLLGKWHVSEAHFTHDGKDWCEVISQADCTHWLPFPKAPTWDDMPIHASAPSQGVAEPTSCAYCTKGTCYKHEATPQPAEADKLREALKELADASEIFMAGGVVGLRQTIDKAQALLKQTTRTGAAVAVQAAGQQEIYYVRKSEIEALRDPRVAGRGMMLSKDPADDRIAVIVAASMAAVPAKEGDKP